MTMLSLQRFQSLFITFTLLIITYFALQQGGDVWRSWLNVIELLPMVLLAVVFLFSAQFNHSRFSYLALGWLGYYWLITQPLSKNNSALIASFLPAKFELGQGILLAINFFILALSFVKDRGLLSVHTLTRIVLALSCLGFAYVWIWLGDYLTLDNLQHFAIVKPLMSWWLEIPMVLSLVALLGRAIYLSNLLQASLVTTFFLAVALHYQLLTLPLSLIISVVAIQYILVVVTNSYFLAYRDELTGLPSRRALNQLALSLGRRYTVAMMDIDHFKKFNDTYGHDIGDQVLKLVASKLRQVKGGGKVFRYGGEEFTVVFARKTQEQAVAELELVRQAVADYQIAIRQEPRANKEQRGKDKQLSAQTVSVTISIGVAEREKKQSFVQALKAADVALYRAKKKGRNNVSI